MVKTVKSKRASNYEVGSSARALAALATGGGDLLASGQSGEVVESLSDVIKTRETDQLDNLEYFDEIKRRIDAGSATDDEKLEYEYRQLEITERAEQEAARTEASYAIMSMATSAVQSYSNISSTTTIYNTMISLYCMPGHIRTTSSRSVKRAVSQL